VRFVLPIALALLVAGCSSGSGPSPTRSPSPTPATAAPAVAAPVPAAPCPVSSARSDGALDLGGGRTVIVALDPPALVVDGVARELEARGEVYEAALACAADGRYAVAWIESEGEDVQRLRLARGDQVVTLSRSTEFDALNPALSGLALAFEPDGELLVAFGEGPRVRAVTVSPLGTVGRTVTLGATIQFTQAVAEVAANGRAVVAWATQDGGIEANRPVQVRAATRQPGRWFTEAQLVSSGTSADPLEPAPLDLALAVADNGRAALQWGDLTGSRRSGGFRHAVLVGELGQEPRRLTRDGEVRDVAIRADGTILAVFVSGGRLRAVIGERRVDLGRADDARAFFDTTGRPTVELSSGALIHP
jgi:hypothetical protein